MLFWITVHYFANLPFFFPLEITNFYYIPVILSPNSHKLMNVARERQPVSHNFQRTNRSLWHIIDRNLNHRLESFSSTNSTIETRSSRHRVGHSTLFKLWLKGLAPIAKITFPTISFSRITFQNKIKFSNFLIITLTVILLRILRQYIYIYIIYIYIYI